MKLIRIDPLPDKRKDGGVDYKMENCENACYWTDDEGCYVGKCQYLHVNIREIGTCCKKNND